MDFVSSLSLIVTEPNCHHHCFLLTSKLINNFYRDGVRTNPTVLWTHCEKHSLPVEGVFRHRYYTYIRDWKRTTNNYFCKSIHVSLFLRWNEKWKLELMCSTHFLCTSWLKPSLYEVQWMGEVLSCVCWHTIILLLSADFKAIRCCVVFLKPYNVPKCRLNFPASNFDFESVNGFKLLTKGALFERKCIFAMNFI